jgi:hypothetical protein
LPLAWSALPPHNHDYQLLLGASLPTFALALDFEGAVVPLVMDAVVFGALGSFGFLGSISDGWAVAFAINSLAFV